MKRFVLKNSKTAVYLPVNIWIASEKCYETNPEVLVWRCSVEKVYLEISLNLQENTCARVSFLPKFDFNKVSSKVLSYIECRQKQPSSGVLRKSCSIIVALQYYWNCTSAWMFSCPQNGCFCIKNIKQWITIDITLITLAGSPSCASQPREWHISLANAFFPVSIWRE